MRRRCRLPWAGSRNCTPRPSSSCFRHATELRSTVLLRERFRAYDGRVDWLSFGFPRRCAGKVRTPFVYAYEGEDAVRHLLLVAAGIDSMVVGEAQILGQVKEGYRQACAAKSAGKILNRLFHCAFSTAKSIHTTTSISNGRVSVAGVAVELAIQLFADLAGARVVVIGAGETGTLVVQHLLEGRVHGYYRRESVSRTRPRSGQTMPHHRSSAGEELSEQSRPGRHCDLFREYAGLPIQQGASFTGSVSRTRVGDAVDHRPRRASGISNRRSMRSMASISIASTS